MDRKGITPVISVVLLLMITISVVAIAYFWFGDTINALMGKVGGSIDTDVGRTQFDIEIVGYDLECNGTYDNIAKSNADGQVVRNITLVVMGKSLGVTKKELETISIKSIVIDGKVVGDGDYREGLDRTMSSGELLTIRINNTGSHQNVTTAYISDLKINESDADATADNPMHEEKVEILFSTDVGTSVKRTLAMDANEKCL